MNEIQASMLVERLNDIVTRFGRSVDKLQQVEAMKAENMQREIRGESMAYVHDDFINIQPLTKETE